MTISVILSEVEGSLFEGSGFLDRLGMTISVILSEVEGSGFLDRLGMTISVILSSGVEGSGLRFLHSANASVGMTISLHFGRNDNF
jgi:hypothetical protein